MSSNPGRVRAANYRDNCFVCKRLMRNYHTKAIDFPGTTSRGSATLCSKDYQAYKRAEQPVPVAPTTEVSAPVAPRVVHRVWSAAERAVVVLVGVRFTGSERTEMLSQMGLLPWQLLPVLSPQGHGRLSNLQ